MILHAHLKNSDPDIDKYIEDIDKFIVYVAESNLRALFEQYVDIPDVNTIEQTRGVMTVGKRTQKQVQLSKKNAENSAIFNNLRLGLFENDLLILLKYRNQDGVLAVGIPQIFYLDLIPDYANKYETNTYLRMPLER